MSNLVPKSDLRKVFLRSFTIQATWNYKSLIGMGFAYCMIPIAKRLFHTPEERSAFLRRHLEFFNSHPYFTGWCLGAVVRLEEEAAAAQKTQKEQISLFKQQMSGPLGSLGDQLFWSRWKPLTSAAALCIALLFGWIAVPIYLLVYNIPHLFARYYGMKKGYERGFNVIEVLTKLPFGKITSLLSGIGIMVAGFLTILAADWCLAKNEDFVLFIVFWCCFAAASILVILRRSVHFILLTVLAVSLLVGLLFSVY
ncbi:MAG: PTS system mannose/fructose/sorbose family transporter subunit IID [candidate division KSB1 bacterium]|nr:PTS system mannose/fructose/sorbose family transporter subunit IID [candidate division KSB1 bacterium]